MPWAELSIGGLWFGIVAITLGVIVIAFPRILNYLIAGIAILFGILWIIGGAWLPGIVSLLFGLAILVFPAFWNYLVAGYLILMGVWLIFGADAMVVGIVTLVFGVIVAIFPSILNYIFGFYLIMSGVIAIANHYGWFGDFFMLLPFIRLVGEKGKAWHKLPLPVSNKS
ncbi:MAG: DUF3096 domain-containing protein [Dehalococcoidia bacterium]|nr:DUF3096 domain-containing protein [Dehalococcoidia bacterium]